MENTNNSWKLLYSCWIISFIATLGSLFFSEVMEFPPCILCWYQRIAMYPLVFIFLVGALREDLAARFYALPIALTGWIIALYHCLVYYGVVPESATPCKEGVSCSAVFIDWFGFMSIPLLSFIAFSLILLLLFNYKRITKNG
jgi:disulfide bond formation protein DsbB